MGADGLSQSAACRGHSLTEPVVGVVCALRSEARHLGRTLAGQPGLESLPDGPLLAVTGAGLAAAAAGAERLIAAGATSLLSWGMAGGLDPQLRAGDLLLPAEISGPEGQVLASDARWRAQLTATLSALQPRACGRLVSARAPVTTAAAKAALWRAGASAVDMESSAVAALCAGHRLPFIAVRAIIDEAGTELPGALATAMRADGGISPWPVLGCLLREPGQLGALLRLARAYAAANRTLAAAARRGALRPLAIAPGAAALPAAGAS